MIAASSRNASRPAVILAAALAMVLAFFLFVPTAAATTAGSGIDLGGDPAGAGVEVTSITTDGAIIDLIPGVSQEVSPEEAVEAGQGTPADTAAAAGVGDDGSILWVIGGALVLIGGALVISRVGKSATR